MSEKFNKPNKKDDNLNQERHETEESLYGNQKYLFEKEHGIKYPEVGWVSEPTSGGAKLKITKVFEKDGDPYIEFIKIYNEEEKEFNKEDIEKSSSPEKAPDELKKEGKGKKIIIDETVKSHKEVEKKAAGGKEIPGADEIDEERGVLVKGSEREIDKVSGEVNYKNMSDYELQGEWEKIKKELDLADKNKNEEAYNINYKKIKEIEEIRENNYISEIKKRNNFLKSQRGAENEVTKNYKNYQEFLKNPSQDLIDLHQKDLDKEYELLSKEEASGVNTDLIAMHKRNIDMLSSKINLFKKYKDNPAINEVIMKKEETEDVEKKPEESVEDLDPIEKESLVPTEEEKNDKEEYKFNQEVIAAFAEFNISEKDLESIEVFKELNPGAQLLIAKQILVMSLDSAKSDVSKKQGELFKDKKRWYGKIIPTIKSVWNKNVWEREAKELQKKSGIEKHKNNIINLSSLIAKMEIKGEIKNGEQTFDFIDINKKESENPDKKEALKYFNYTANQWAKIPENYNEEYATSDQKKEYKEALDSYKKAKDSVLEGEDLEMAEEVNKIDLQISVLKIVNSTPEIEKDWQKMSRGKLRRIGGYFADKGAYMAAGFGARLLTGSLLGPVAVIPAAMGTGALMGRQSAIKQFRGLDQNKSRKIHEKNHPLLKARAEAYKKLQSFYNNKNIEFEEKTGKRIISEELKTNKEYQEALKNFQSIDNQVKHFSDKSINKKTELADSMGEKIQKLIKDYNDPKKEKKEEILRMLNSRVNFSLEKISNDLINYGSEEQKTKNLLNFYQIIGQAKMLIIKGQGEGISLDEASYSRGEESINIKERIEKALDKYEEITEQKLSANRRKDMRKKMLNGAMMAGGLVMAGGLIAEVKDFFSVGSADELLSGGGTEVGPGEGVDPETGGGTEVGPGEGVDPETGGETEVEPGGEEGGVETDDGITPFEELKENGSLSNAISNEGLKPGQYDSIWRSARQLFMNNASDLGFEGDINDASALRAWAENMTRESVNRMEDVTDKVFEGNIISIDQNEAGEYIINVEQGDGLEPGYLSDQDVNFVERPEGNISKMDPKSFTMPEDSSFPSGEEGAGSEPDLSPEEGPKSETEPKPEEGLKSETEPESGSERTEPPAVDNKLVGAELIIVREEANYLAILINDNILKDFGVNDVFNLEGYGQTTIMEQFENIVGVNELADKMTETEMNEFLKLVDNLKNSYNRATSGMFKNFTIQIAEKYR